MTLEVWQWLYIVGCISREDHPDLCDRIDRAGCEADSIRDRVHIELSRDDQIIIRDSTRAAASIPGIHDGVHPAFRDVV